MKSCSINDQNEALQDFARLVRNKLQPNKDDQLLTLVTQGLKQAVLSLGGSGQKFIEVMARLVYKYIVGEAIGGDQPDTKDFRCKIVKYFY